MATVPDPPAMVPRGVSGPADGDGAVIGALPPHGRRPARQDQRSAT